MPTQTDRTCSSLTVGSAVTIGNPPMALSQQFAIDGMVDFTLFSDINACAINIRDQAGFGRLRYDAINQTYQAEFLLPIVADTQAEDANLDMASRYNILLFDYFEPNAGTGNLGGAYGTSADASGWPLLPHP